jgi:hypothetical protein
MPKFEVGDIIQLSPACEHDDLHAGDEVEIVRVRVRGPNEGVDNLTVRRVSDGYERACYCFWSATKISSRSDTPFDKRVRAYIREALQCSG